MTRITPGISVKVIRQVEKLSLKEKEVIFDEIYIEQPHISNMTNKNKNGIEAKKKYRLSDMHIRMARELGMNPKKFGGLANRKR